MTGRTLLLATCAAALLGGGYWLARASSASSPSSSASATAQVRTASLPVAAVAPARAAAPALPTHVADLGLASDLADRDPKIRRAAMHEATRDPDVDVQLLLDATRDSDLEVSGTATIALGKAYAQGRVPATELVARIRDNSLDPKVRLTALNGLGGVASPESATVLVELVASGSTTERAAAATLLQRQDLAVAVPALIRALGDSDAHVRQCAVGSLKARSRGRDFGEDRAAWQAWWDTRRH